MSTRASVLVPEPQSLFLPLVAATFLHASVLVCLLLGEFLADWWTPSKPLIDPRETRPMLCRWIEWTRPLLPDLLGPRSFPYRA